jgi:hypothetical protein
MSLDDLAFEASDLTEATKAYLLNELPGNSKLRQFLAPICEIHMGIGMRLYTHSKAIGKFVYYDNRPTWERMLKMFGLDDENVRERRVLYHIHTKIWGQFIFKACTAGETQPVENQPSSDGDGVRTDLAL